MKKRLVSLLAILLVVVLALASCGDDELVANLESQVKDLESEIVNLEDELAEKDDELSEKDNEIDSLKSEIAKIEAENANLSSQIAELEQRIENLLNDKDYTASFNINGGEGVIEDQIVRYKKTVNEPTSPTKEHYEFVGWYVNGVKAEFPCVITANTEFVAEYNPIKYTVTYNANDGTMPESYVTEYDVETSVALPTPTRDLYLFDGWYEDANFEGEKVSEIKAGEFGDRTFYAKWLSTTDGIKYLLTSGSTCYYKVIGYDGKDTVVVIPDSVDGIPVTEIVMGAFKDKQRITSITVPDSITKIGSSAFSGCINLTELNLGTGVKTIPSSMVSGCSKLESIEIPHGVTLIDNNAFYNCSSLTSIVIPDSVTSIDWYAFRQCNSLSSIIIPDSVTSIGMYAFAGCSKLTSVTMGNGITSIGEGVFENCSGLTAVYITDLIAWCSIDFYGFTSNPLYYAKNLYVNNEFVTDLVIPDGVKFIGKYSFGNCSSLINVTIPDSVTSIGNNAFWGCSSLTSITIPDSVTSIGNYAFEYCSNLYVVYNNSDNLVFEMGSVNNGYIAYYAKILIDYGEATYAEDGYNYTLTDDGFLFREKGSKYELIAYIGGEETVTLPLDFNGNSCSFYYMSGVRNVIIPEGFTAINDYAFWCCYSLVSVTIPDSVTFIGERAFSDCKNLASVVIGNGVTIIGNGAFSGCKSLTNIVIPNSVTSIGNSAFYDCDSLANIVIPDSVTSIDNSTFYDCDSLANIVIPDSVTSIGSDAFCNCSSLVSVVIGDSVAFIDDCAFYYCYNLASITVEKNNQYYKSIDGNLYTKDGSTLVQYAIGKKDTSFVIPDSVTTIGSSAFSGCSSLTSVTIPDSVASIGAYAFDGCSSLVSVVIGDSVTSIDFWAFSGCSSLISVYYDGTEENWKKISIDYRYGSNEPLINATRYYYSETEPTEAGNFWHWGENGEVVIW